MYRSLAPDQIIQTIEQLRDRIGERFPKANLYKVAEEFLRVAREAAERATQIGKPFIPLRIGIALLLLVFFAVIIEILVSLPVGKGFNSLPEFIQAIEASFNVIILLSGGIYFLVSLETRIKRTRALKMIHELRALAHIVDVHQLTKDPERLQGRGRSTSSSPARTMNRFELSRYLDYCSEMLSLMGKIAALYAQYFNDAVVLNAVDDIEDLTTGLSQKIWQKITILNQTGSAPPFE